MKKYPFIFTMVLFGSGLFLDGCDGKESTPGDADDDEEEVLDTEGDGVADVSEDDVQGDDGIVGEGACTNEHDLAIIRDPETNVKSRAQNCMIECIAAQDVVECAVSCLQDATELSDDCSACFAGRIDCSISHCIDFCTVSPEGDPCRECMETNGCSTAFEECSGLADE
jgi:hypothetical protein